MLLSSDEEAFGCQGLAVSESDGLGVLGIRTRILDDVTRFCNGNFHDDASLMVVTVDQVRGPTK